MALESIISEKTETKVGSSGTKVYTATRTIFERDSTGNIDPKSIKYELLYFDAPLSPGLVAATNSAGSNKWTLANKPLSNNPILGADAQKSLHEGALKNETFKQIEASATKAKLKPEEVKTVSTPAKNNAVPGQESSEAIAAGEQEVQTVADKTRTGKNSFGSLKYPLTLAESKQDVIKFEMLSYAAREYKNVGESNALNPVGERKKQDTLGTVYLPIPSGISDSSSVNWGSDELSASSTMAVDIASRVITEGGGGGANSIENIATSVAGGGGDDAKTALKTAFIEAATGTQNILSRTTGAVINPNMELLFLGPQLRPFSFTFKFSARNKPESEQIAKIIRFFKQGMSPIRTKNQLFLKAPHVFQLSYLHKNTPHFYLNRFKQCALTSFSVDYTPEGQYATFQSGAMVSYQISMQFQEIEPIFNDDYSQLDGGTPDSGGIGY